MRRARRSGPAAAEALTAVAPLATRWIERLLACHDPPLTVPQYLALRAIAREPLSGGELARRSGVSGPAVSQLLAGLDGLELLERAPHAEDRRRHVLSLSAEGRIVHASSEALLRDRLAGLFDDLPPHEAEALSRLLPRVEAILSGAPPPRRPPHPRPMPPPSKKRGRRGPR